jgi:hypothetical protein
MKNPATPAVRREAEEDWADNKPGGRDMAEHFYLAPRREDYVRFLAVMVDRDELPQSFEEWQRNIERMLADLKANGLVMKPVVFDAEEFVAFCLARNLPCGSEARAHYAADVGMTGV